MDLIEALRRVELDHPGMEITYLRAPFPRFEIGVGDERLGWVEFVEGGELGRLVAVRPTRKAQPPPPPRWTTI